MVAFPDYFRTPESADSPHKRLVIKHVYPLTIAISLMFLVLKWAD
jgi:hypothetical protein